MAGDVVDTEVNYYYPAGYTDNGSVASGAFLTNLLSIMNGAAPVASESQAVSGAVNGNAATIFAGNNGSNANPRAYLNYILFDRDFSYEDAGYVQVGGQNSTPQPISQQVNIQKTGYIYVYVSNESNNNFDVFFDDLRVTHTKGKNLQEDHYYPFGLGIRALSSSAPLSEPNKFKYNGKELDTDFDLGWYHYGARMYDPETSRFTTIDPKAHKYNDWSPYLYAANNPIRYEDTNGEGPGDKVLGFLAALVDNASGGLFNVRGYAARHVSEGGEKDFNEGQDYGDVGSMLLGGAMVSGGGGASAGGLALAGPSGGLSLGVSAAGAGLIAEGYVLGVNGAYTLASQKGRIAEESDDVGDEDGGPGSGNHYSGNEEALTEGAEPNSIYTRTSGDGKVAVSNYIYDADGKLVYEVDFKRHGKNQPSGHGHRMSPPGDIKSGHLPENHVAPQNVPSRYKVIPEGMTYSQPLYNGGS